MSNPPILVVDDDATLRLMLKTVLEYDGHSIVDACNAAEAEELFKRHKPLLALLDAVMPEVNGFELCERLHAMEGGEDLTVLMVTSLNEDADIERAFAAGAADFINKPVNLTVLRGRVKHLLEGKLAEKQMRAAEEQLRQSYKMSAIGSLSSGIAHEFNNILASVMGYTELLQEYLQRQAEPKPLRYVAEVYRAAERARDLIHQMQLFSQTIPGTPQRLLPTPLIKENLKIIRSSLPSTINLRQQLDEEIPPIMLDPSQFQQLLTNLLINARDAIDEKGTITVSMQRTTLAERNCASCHSGFSGEYVQLCVSDNGSGISHEIQQKMFEPYYTTKPVGRGTGMGLSVVHGIMHELGGHITVQSQYGEGASFCLLFPIIGDDLEQGATMEQHQDDTKQQHKGQHILLVDDEVAITGYLGEMLEMHDYQVTTCNDSQQALLLFLAEPAKFDLVITDMTLPGLTGIELANGMLHLRPDLPVILCSGYIDERTRQSIGESGIRTAFNKPVDSRALLESVGQLLRAI